MKYFFWNALHATIPFKEEGEETKKEIPSQLGDNVYIIPFVKSPISVNPAMSSIDKLYLQGMFVSYFG